MGIIKLHENLYLKLLNYIKMDMQGNFIKINAPPN